MDTMNTVRSNRRHAVLAAGALLLATTAPSSPAAAGEPYTGPREEGAGVTVHLGGPATVAARQWVETLVVVGDRATIDGTVTQALVVGGEAVIAGTVIHDLTVVGGRLTLGPRARVGGNVSLFRSELDRQPGSSVGGEVHVSEQGWPSGRARFFLWLAITGSVLLAGLAWLLFAAPILQRGAGVMVSEPPATALSTLAVWLGSPVAAVIAMVTVVGIPAGLALLLGVLPVLWSAGFTVVALAIGGALLRALRGTRPAASTLGSGLLGLLVLQALAVVPVVGPALALFAGCLGAGALTWSVIRDRRRPAADGQASAGAPALPGPVAPQPGTP